MRGDSQTPAPAGPAGRPEVTLLYDGACPFCRRQAARLRRIDRRGALAFTDIAEAGFDPGRYGLERAQAGGALHAVLADGTAVRAMEAVRAACRAAGRGWLAAPTAWPVLRPLCDAAYRAFARRRARAQRPARRRTSGRASSRAAGSRAPRSPRA